MDPYIGEIRLFAGDYAPQNWLLCNGAVIPISEYQALFTLIGTAFGGDGVNNFALPKLGGRVAIGSGQGVNLSNRPYNTAGGAEAVALTTANIPSHGHGFFVANQTAVSATPSPSVTFGNVDAAHSFYIDTAQPTTGSIDLGTNAVSSAGTGAPHDNMMPSLALTYIICFNGVYPSFG